MEIILIVIVAAVAFWYYMMLRGRKAVRAYFYLCALDDNIPEDEANGIASRIDLAAASRFQADTLNFVNSIYGGSQLAMISQARISGFNE